jgi:hypothetical protein
MSMCKSKRVSKRGVPLSVSIEYLTSPLHFSATTFPSALAVSIIFKRESNLTPTTAF